MILLLTAVTLSAVQPVKIAVMPAKFLKSARGVEAQSFDEAVLAAVQSAGNFSVIGRSDMNAVLGYEKQKQILGCNDTACFAEIGGALGVERLVDIQVAKTDDSWTVSAKLIDIKQATPQVLNRVYDAETKGGTGALISAVPRIIGKLMSAKTDAAMVYATTAATRGDIVFETDSGSFAVHLDVEHSPNAARDVLKAIDSNAFDGGDLWGSSAFVSLNSLAIGERDKANGAHCKHGEVVLQRVRALGYLHICMEDDPPKLYKNDIDMQVIGRVSSGFDVLQRLAPDASRGNATVRKAHRL